jgi:hypothetical protein
MEREPIKKPPVDGCDTQLSRISKGQLLGVMTPPYYTKEYVYEVTGCGDKIIRAILKGSAKVRKSWSREELLLLLEMGMVRLIDDV